MRQIPFTLDVGIKSADELPTGSLRIRGVGAHFDFWDLEGETFVRKAFEKGLRDYLAAGGPLLHSHRFDQPIGRVVSADLLPDRLEIEAIVDYQPESSPLRWLYNAVKSKAVTGLSAGGIWQKRSLPDGRKEITEATILEWSVAAVPMARGATHFKVSPRARR
jgi:phage head maturation protease